MKNCLSTSVIIVPLIGLTGCVQDSQSFSTPQREIVQELASVEYNIGTRIASINCEVDFLVAEREVKENALEELQVESVEYNDLLGEIKHIDFTLGNLEQERIKLDNLYREYKSRRIRAEDQLKSQDEENFDAGIAKRGKEVRQREEVLGRSAKNSNLAQQTKEADDNPDVFWEDFEAAWGE